MNIEKGYGILTILKNSIYRTNDGVKSLWDLDKNWYHDISLCVSYKKSFIWKNLCEINLKHWNIFYALSAVGLIQANKRLSVNTEK